MAGRAIPPRFNEEDIVTDRLGLSKRVAMLCLVVLPAVAFLARPVVAAQEAPPTFHYVPQKLTSADRKTTAKLYLVTCSGCHGKNGEGNGNGLALYGSKDPLSSASSMHFGRAEPPPLKTVMPAYGAQSILTQKEIAQLAAYIAEFRPPWP